MQISVFFFFLLILYYYKTKLEGIVIPVLVGTLMALCCCLHNNEIQPKKGLLWSKEIVFHRQTSNGFQLLYKMPHVTQAYMEKKKKSVFDSIFAS